MNKYSFHILDLYFCYFETASFPLVISEGKGENNVKRWIYSDA